MNFAAVYHDQVSVDRMAGLVSPRVEAFVHRLLGIASYEYSDGRYPGFSSEIVGCHFPLTDAHVEHINRVVVGHLMLQCEHLAYFANRLDPTLARGQRQTFDLQLQYLGQIFRGQINPPGMDSPLKQPLVFALAILHDIGKTAFLDDAGHEERARKLVYAILDQLHTRLDLSSTEVKLGTNLVESHTMLGTLVQAEHSAQEVRQYLDRSCNTDDEKQMLLSYLLLLNSMDLSGYRYLPIILDPYWTERYIKFFNLKNLEEYTSDYNKFALYRLRELARSDVSDVGDSDEKRGFYDACRDEFEKLDEETRKKFGTMRIRDALYLTIDFNHAAVGHTRQFPVKHATTYVGFLKTLAEIANHARAHTIAFRGEGSRTVDAKSLSLLVHKIQTGHPVCDPFSFAASDGVVQFTIASDGTIVP